MTNEEACRELAILWLMFKADSELSIALDMAIEALKEQNQDAERKEE